MDVDPLLGRRKRLCVRRLGPAGAFLTDGTVDSSPSSASAPTILLPRRELPADVREGDELDVFVYLDSEDRPVATTSAPAVALDEVAFLPVTDVNRFGAFVAWGLPKELLVPFAEQTRELRVGERHPIGLYIDSSGRLAGTMRVSEMLRSQGTFAEDEWVVGEAWRLEPGIGTFVIVERSFVGLLPDTEPHALTRGEQARFRIANVLNDGKIELSLRGHAHEELEGDAERVRAALARPGGPRVSDRSSPEAIRTAFGLSKKAFKRAAGRLLKQGLIAVDAQGLFVAASPKDGTRQGQ